MVWRPAARSQARSAEWPIIIMQPRHLVLWSHLGLAVSIILLCNIITKPLAWIWSHQRLTQYSITHFLLPFINKIKAKRSSEIFKRTLTSFLVVVGPCPMQWQWNGTPANLGWIPWALPKKSFRSEADRFWKIEWPSNGRVQLSWKHKVKERGWMKWSVTYL